MKEDSARWKSRKLWIAVCFSLLLYFGPVLYATYGVDPSMGSVSLGAIAAICTGYLGFNVLQKKLLGDGDV